MVEERVTAIKLWKELAKGKIFPVYYFYGEEEYLKERAIRKIQEIFLTPRSGDFEVFYGSEVKGVEIIRSIQTIPFLSPKRLILIKEVRLLPQDFWKEFVAFIPSTSCVIFLAEKPRPELSQKWIKVVEFRPPKGGESKYWIREIAKELGKRIDEGAINLLEELVSQNLEIIFNELHKLANFVGESELIKDRDVLQVTTFVKPKTLFELIELVNEGDAPKALETLHRLLAEGIAPLVILTFIVRHFRRLTQAKKMRKDEIPPQEIGKRLNIHPFFLKDFLRQTDQFPSKEVPALFFHFLQADLTLKSSKITKQIILERLIIELCSQKP